VKEVLGSHIYYSSGVDGGGCGVGSQAGRQAGRQGVIRAGRGCEVAQLGLVPQVLCVCVCVCVRVFECFRSALRPQPTDDVHAMMMSWYRSAGRLLWDLVSVSGERRREEEERERMGLMG